MEVQNLSSDETSAPEMVDSKIKLSEEKMTPCIAMESTNTPTNTEMTVSPSTESTTVLLSEIDETESSAKQVRADELDKTMANDEESPADTHTACSDVQKDESISHEAAISDTNNEIVSSIIISVQDVNESPASSDAQKNHSIPCEAANSETNNKDTVSTIPTSETNTDQSSVENQTSSKENYRTIEDSSDSDTDTEDSDSSSVSSLSCDGDAAKDNGNGAGSDEDDDDMSPKGQQKKGSYPVVKVRGELEPEDLPPLEELHITVPSSLCAEIGVVSSIVNTLVVIQAHHGIPALDLDSVLFLDKGSRALGLIFDVFGPVKEPMYCVRFNSTKHIEEFQVKAGDKVYFAPRTEHSKYVFLKQLLEMRGSDASWRNDMEPTVQIDFSDDEEERKAKKESSSASTAEKGEDQQKRKRDQMEDSGNKKEQKPHLRNTQWRPRGGMARTGQSTSRPSHQGQRPQYSNQGHIRPSSFTAPDFSTPPPTVTRPPIPAQNSVMPERANSSYNYPPPDTQNPYNAQPYRNFMQPSSSFGQLPYGPVQTQLDPRLVQFGTQFAQMMCALQQSPSTTYTPNVPPPPPSSLSLPYSQSTYHGDQNSFSAMSNHPPSQNQLSYPQPSFNTPPPMVLTGPPPNLPPTNVPPPFGGNHVRPQSHNFPPNQSSSYQQQYPSPHSSSYRGCR